MTAQPIFSSAAYLN